MKCVVPKVKFGGGVIMVWAAFQIYAFQLCAPVLKVKYMKARFVEFGVEELQRSAQSPDLNPTEHLWNELERCL